MEWETLFLIVAAAVVLVGHVAAVVCTKVRPRKEPPVRDGVVRSLEALARDVKK